MWQLCILIAVPHSKYCSAELDGVAHVHCIDVSGIQSLHEVPCYSTSNMVCNIVEKH